MRVLFASSEVHPLAKTGGLADVSEALPTALAEMGVDIRLIMPGYPAAMERAEKAGALPLPGAILGFKDIRLVQARLPKTGLPLWLVDCPALFDRGGSLYQDESGREWPDNAERFALFSHVAAKLALGETPLDWVPDIVHANDWHTGLLPALLSEAGEPRPPTIFTVHNMAFQGLFPAEALARIGCNHRFFNADGFEYYGQISYLKSGIRFADHVTTVSPSYAREIMTPDYGFGLDGLLRRRSQQVSGILNGVDYSLWDPRHDPYLTDPYGADSIAGKQACKRQLQAALGLDVDAARPVVAYMSRLAHQKMADCVLEALPRMAERGVQFVLLAEGDPALAAAFREAAARLPGVAVRIGYEEASAHRLLAGADILLAPSRFEPCGLTHLYAMRYGTVPVVRRTGGLIDTVVPETGVAAADRAANGFFFEEPTTEAMIEALNAALATLRYPLSWRRLMLNGMAADFGWEKSARHYAALYARLHAEEAQPTADTEIEGDEEETVREAG